MFFDALGAINRTRLSTPYVYAVGTGKEHCPVQNLLPIAQLFPNVTRPSADGGIPFRGIAPEHSCQLVFHTAAIIYTVSAYRI
jgi:hypothetical protein